MRRFVMGAVLACTVVLGSTPAVSLAQSVNTGSVAGFWQQAGGSLTVDHPADDRSFYRAPDGVDLAALPPGAVLKERTLSAHLATLELPLRMTQLLYTTRNARGQAVANVTSVLHPPGPADGNVVAYQSFYDSLDPADNPSRFLSGNMTIGGVMTGAETVPVGAALLAGHRVVLADTEGPEAEFAAGPAYGRATLDSLRAATSSPLTGIRPDHRIGLMGYSGGAIASNWAAIQVADYAPELAPRIVGVAQGGVLVDPIHNLGYAGEGIAWSPVVAMALVGLARAYDVDVRRYMTEAGLRIYDDVKDLSIIEAFARYPSLRWAEFAKPEFPTPQSAPELWPIIQSINMGVAPIPAIPMLIHQGAAGWIEGTPPQIPGVGVGDGIMVTGDVRSLARRYCAAGTRVEYREHGLLSHAAVALPWMWESFQWLEARFHGVPAPENCAMIPEGTPIG